MTKAELIARVARETKITKVARTGHRLHHREHHKGPEKRREDNASRLRDVFCGKAEGQNRQESPHGGGDSGPGRENGEVQVRKGVKGGGEVKLQRSALGYQLSGFPRRMQQFVFLTQG